MFQKRGKINNSKVLLKISNLSLSVFIDFTNGASCDKAAVGSQMASGSSSVGKKSTSGYLHSSSNIATSKQSEQKPTVDNPIQPGESEPSNIIPQPEELTSDALSKIEPIPNMSLECEDASSSGISSGFEESTNFPLQTRQSASINIPVQKDNPSSSTTTPQIGELRKQENRTRDGYRSRMKQVGPAKTSLTKYSHLLEHYEWEKLECCHCSQLFKTEIEMEFHTCREKYKSKRSMQSYHEVVGQLKKRQKHDMPSYEQKKRSGSKYVQTLMGYADKHPCNNCDKKFASGGDLKHHKWIAHEMTLLCFQCKYCSMCTESLQSLKKHVWSHEKKYKAFWVSRQMTGVKNRMFCPGTSRDSLELVIGQDQNTVSTSQPLRCLYCLKTFSAQFQVDLHSLWHVNYACCICGAAFVHKEVLMAHIRSHPDLTQHQCKCHILWSNPQHVQILGVLHVQGMTNNICRSCGHQFGHVKDEERHRVCIETINYLYLCCYCHIVVGGPVSLGEHKKKCHSDVYTCTLPMLPIYQHARYMKETLPNPFQYRPSNHTPSASDNEDDPNRCDLVTDVY